jgi:hypothetical protein
MAMVRERTSSVLSTFAQRAPRIASRGMSYLATDQRDHL